MGNQSSGMYDGTITIHNQSPHTIQTELMENEDPNKRYSYRRRVRGSGGILIISPGGYGKLKIPDTIDWDKDYPFNDVLDHRFIKVEFSDDSVNPVMYHTGYLNFVREMECNVLVMKNCDVTHLSDPYINRSDYPDLFKIDESKYSSDDEHE